MRRDLAMQTPEDNSTLGCREKIPLKAMERYLRRSQPWSFLDFRP